MTSAIRRRGRGEGAAPTGSTDGRTDTPSMSRLLLAARYSTLHRLAVAATRLRDIEVGRRHVGVGELDRVVLEKAADGDPFAGRKIADLDPYSVVLRMIR